MYEFTENQVKTWNDSWAEYRNENDGMICNPTPERSTMDFYLFYLCSITYAAIESDDVAMKALDIVLGEWDSEQLHDVDAFLTEFHDYLIIMGVVET